MASDGKVTISTQLDNAGIEKGVKQVKGSLGGLTKVLTGATAAIVAATTAAVATITKQSVDAFADYQQLTGGIATLFGKSADKVVQYAENAFFTAGVSANEYMENVTSFSASLISSLGGDTEKAAEIANMALQDMADNANKMGSRLESVQAAYQGFAKQQYTLLDNLKLGYGGTKTEMERLLKDAEAYSGVKYDIKNLGDVYNAIHVIQEKLKITGATAEEAEKTITGSANMTKAAWKNVLTAISGGGDLDKAINNLVYSVSKYFENITPVVERSLSGIGQLIEKIAPQLVQTVAVSLIKAIPSLLNAVYQMILGLAKGIYQGVVALFSGGSVTGSISKQLNTVAEGYGAAAGGAEDLTEATEAAGKAAKKALAGFDELNVLAAPGGGVASDMETPADGGSISAGDISIGGEVKDNISPVVQTVLDKVKQLLEPLRDIDLGPAGKAFSDLGTSIGNLGTTIGDSLEWAWFNILVPLSKWGIEVAGPKSVETLSKALDALDKIAKPVLEGLKEMVKNLEPTFALIGDVYTDVVEDLGLAWEDVGDTFEENGPTIQSALSSLGAALNTFWTTVGPIFFNLAKAAGDFLGIFYNSETLAAILGFFGGILDFISGVFSGDWDLAWSGISQCFTSWWDGMVAQWERLKSWLDEYIVAPLSDVALWIDDNIITPIDDWFWDLTDSISSYLDDCWTNIQDAWSGVSSWFDEKIIEPVDDAFSNMWTDLSQGAQDAWSGVQSAFSSVTSWFETTFGDAWEGVKDVFTTEGTVFEGIKEGISSVFTTVVNGIIDGLNLVVAAPFNAINGILNTIRNIEFLEIRPFSGLWSQNPLTVPQIPKLAKGAVLPANKPFLAMVGDQKHGTNIEAPLTTIQEAVALVMQDFVDSNLAGNEAIVAVLREILEAVLGIQIGDDVIGNAVERFNRKRSVMRGSAV